MQVHWCWCVNFWRSTLLWGKILLSLFKSQVQFSLLFLCLDEKMQSFYIPPNPAIHSESRENVHFENSFNPSWCCISHHCAKITLIDKGVENSVEWCQCHCDKSVSLFLHPHAFLLLVAFPPPLFRDFFRLCHPRLYSIGELFHHEKELRILNIPWEEINFSALSFETMRDVRPWKWHEKLSFIMKQREKGNLTLFKNCRLLAKVTTFLGIWGYACES